jgi:hypothetical protein
MAIAILGAHTPHAALAVLSAERELPTALGWGGAGDPRHSELGEPDLAARFERACASGRLRVTRDPEEAARDAWVVVLCGEPSLPSEATSASYRELEELATRIAPVLRPGVLVCIEAHLAPGDVRSRIAPRLAEGSKLGLGEELLLAFSPPRATPGHAFSDGARIPQVLGAWNDASLARANEFYLRIADSILVPTSSLEAAELVSVVERAHRELASAFVHEVSRLARARSLDPEEVLGYAGLRPYFPLHRPGLAHLGDGVEIAARLLAGPEGTPLLALAQELQERSLADGVDRLEETLGGLADQPLELWVDGAPGALAPSRRVERFAAALLARGARLARREIAPQSPIRAHPDSSARAIVVATERVAWPRIDLGSFSRCVALFDASSTLRRRAVEGAGWRYLSF